MATRKLLTLVAGESGGIPSFVLPSSLEDTGMNESSAERSIILAGNDILAKLAPSPGLINPNMLPQLRALSRMRIPDTLPTRFRGQAISLRTLANKMLPVFTAAAAKLQLRPTHYCVLNWYGGYTSTGAFDFRTPFQGSAWRLLGFQASRETANVWGMFNLNIGGINHITTTQSVPVPANPLPANAQAWLDLDTFDPVCCTGERQLLPIGGNWFDPTMLVSVGFVHKQPTVGPDHMSVVALVQSTPCGREVYDKNPFVEASKAVQDIMRLNQFTAYRPIR